MKKTSRFLAVIVAGGILSFASAVQADPDLSLFEGCLSVDGDIFNASSNGEINCAEANPGDDVAGLGADGLGDIEVILNSEGAHSVGLFVDHEIDQDSNTYFNEVGAPAGALEAGQSWEIDEPFFFGDIYDNFLDGSLDNSNGVPPGSPEDVSMALFWDFVLTAGQVATINFLVGDVAPDGFFLQHIDPDSNASIFFSSTLRIDGDKPPPPPPTEVPEPGTLFLLGAGLLGISATRRKLIRG